MYVSNEFSVQVAFTSYVHVYNYYLRGITHWSSSVSGSGNGDWMQLDISVW